MLLGIKAGLNPYSEKALIPSLGILQKKKGLA
jgi:hypothetical protein